MSEYLDNVARALCVLLINEYPNILKEELDRVSVDKVLAALKEELDRVSDDG